MMIIGWLRMLFFALIGLTIVYFLVSIYSRSVRRERLEEAFDAGDRQGNRDEFIRQGLAAYDKGLRRKLLLLIYVVPLAAMFIIAAIVNWS
jgi:hypothetical protein